MVFILLLALSTISIAGAAAFFSVYGLAYTFSGTFWSVVVMGSSLEAGKLMAASYLYRFWGKTNYVLKIYLILGVVALMILTSTGIFGYLSAGYQTDTLPLQQIASQVQLLEQEKNTKQQRKQQIDTQIAQLPTNTIRGRVSLMKQFKDEQKQVTQRLDDIDKQLLELKSQQIKTESHVGPIIYIAKAFDLDTDNAIKYLIFLIIFAFDPMAIALTIALNIVIRERENRKQTTTEPESVIIKPTTKAEVSNNIAMDRVVDNVVEASPEVKKRIGMLHPAKETIQTPFLASHPWAAPEHHKDEESNATGVVSTFNPPSDATYKPPIDLIHSSVQELVKYYQDLKKQPTLSGEEILEKEAIENILRRQGVLQYIL